MLLFLKRVKRKPGLLRNALHQDVFFRHVIFIGIDVHEAVEYRAGRSDMEDVLARGNGDTRRLITRCRHAARDKTFPDQLVETELFSGQRILHHGRCARDIGRADRLVRVLDVAAFCRRFRTAAEVHLAVLVFDVFGRSRGRFRRDARRIRSEVGDQTDRASRLQVDAFIQLLRDTHGLLRGKIERARCLLL